jgi:hypothetical protein
MAEGIDKKVLLSDLMLITTAAIAYRAMERGDRAQLARSRLILAEYGPTSASLIEAIGRAVAVISDQTN